MSSTSAVSGMAVAVIVAAAAWTIARSVTKPQDNTHGNVKTTADKKEAKDVTAVDNAEPISPMKENHSVCLGQQHPAALLPQNKGEIFLLIPLFLLHTMHGHCTVIYQFNYIVSLFIYLHLVISLCFSRLCSIPISLSPSLFFILALQVSLSYFHFTTHTLRLRVFGLQCHYAHFP